MRTFTHRGLEHGYLDEGQTDEAPAVLFLHGLLVSSGVFRRQIEALAPSHRVLALDWPGHGTSSAASGDASIDDLTDTVVALLDDAGVHRAAVVGLSLGGIVAMAAASRFPDRIEALVLVSTPHGTETDAQRKRHMETLDAASRIGRAPILKGIAVRMFGATTRRLRPELVTRWLDDASRLDLGSLRLLSEAALARGAAPSFGDGVPRALIVRGHEDSLVEPTEAIALSTELGGARIVTIPGSGHLVPVENQGVFTEALVAFLRIPPTL